MFELSLLCRIFLVRHSFGFLASGVDGLAFLSVSKSKGWMFFTQDA
jgi:hypothetical protein